MRAVDVQAVFIDLTEPYRPSCANAGGFHVFNTEALNECGDKLLIWFVGRQ